MEELVCSQQCPQSRSFILTKFEQQGFLKTIEKAKKRITLDPNLHVGSPNPELSIKLFFWETDCVSLQNDAM
jgi:hypothetical protein